MGKITIKVKVKGGYLSYVVSNGSKTTRGGKRIAKR